MRNGENFKLPHKLKEFREAGTLSGLLSYGSYVLDFRLNGTLCAGITRPECPRFKCMELTHLSQDPLQETSLEFREGFHNKTRQIVNILCNDGNMIVFF